MDARYLGRKFLYHLPKTEGDAPLYPVKEQEKIDVERETKKNYAGRSFVWGANKFGSYRATA